MRQVFDVPDRGDILTVSNAPAGRHRSRPGRGAVVVLSPQAYNARVGLAVVCPIVAWVTGYPFEVPVPAGLGLGGAILADQAASLDWRAHRSEKTASLPPALVDEVLAKLRALLA